MKILSTFIMGILTLVSCFSMQLSAEEIVVTPSYGESFVVEVDPSASFLEVMGQIEDYLGTDEMTVSYTMGFREYSSKKKPKGTRNYGASLTTSDKDNIRYIILTLAKSSKLQLLTEESSLKRAGDRINHIHPYRFLQYVFTDDELKVGISVIRSKGGRVWKNYHEGLEESLNDENDLNNLAQFTPEFANSVGVNVDALSPLVQTRNWKGIINFLIDNVPRNGNNRYDM